MTIALYGVAFVFTVTIMLVAFVSLAPKRVITIALSAARKQAALQRKELTLSNGLRIVYLEGGKGVPLMLLHGFGGNKDTFVRVARLLGKRYRIIVPDITGFGESSHPKDADYAPPAQVERLRMFAQALQLKNLHLGGNSMGGMIALQYAALYPEDVESLWLLSPALEKNSFHPDIVKMLAEPIHNPLIATNVNQFAQVMALGMSKPPSIPKPMLKVLAQERIQNAALEAQIFQHLIAHSLVEQIQGMSTPGLIMFGTQDRVISIATAHTLMKLLTKAKLVLIENAGHVPMFEKPAQCAKEYEAFRASLHEVQGPSEVMPP